MGVDLSANSKWKCIFPTESSFQFQQVEIYLQCIIKTCVTEHCLVRFNKDMTNKFGV